MAIYYVSQSGNDGNDGLSEGQPFETLAKLQSVLTDQDIGALTDGYIVYPEFNELPMLPPPSGDGHSTLKLIDGVLMPSCTYSSKN